MSTLVDLHSVVERIAPPGLAESWDNVGWQVRSASSDITGILTSVDATLDVVAEARELGANVILCHHPILYRPLRTVDVTTRIGQIVAAALSANLSILTAHTNWDAAANGVSWALARALGLDPEGTIQPRDGAEGAGFGVIARSSRPIVLAELIEQVQSQLRSPVSLVAGGEPLHSRIALMGGSGSGAIGAAAALGATLYVTADIRYHDAQEAESLGLSLLVIDHAASEQPGMLELANQIRAQLPVPVYASRVQTTPWKRMTQ